MGSVESLIAANYARVSGRIEEACRRAGRPASDVRLVAVTKSAEIGWIEALLAMGVRDLAESRPQQLCERALLLDKSARWHLVGHLQRNKVRKVLPAASWIHSVDTLPLLRRLDAAAGELRLRPRLLLEVNVSDESGQERFSAERAGRRMAGRHGCFQRRHCGAHDDGPLGGVARSGSPRLRRPSRASRSIGRKPVNGRFAGALDGNERRF